MRRESRSTKALHVVAAAALIVLAGGGTALGLGDGQPTEKTTSPPAEEQAGGAGCCRGRMQGDGEACQGRNSRRGTEGMRQRRGGGPGRGAGARHGGQGGRHGGNRDLMESIRALVHDYRHDVVREVEEIENGVVTVTRIPDHPEAVLVLQKHVGEMKGLLETGGRIRSWDPLFSEIFDHHEKIELSIENLDDGVRVTETSADPKVAKLIQAHARKVDDFVARGPAAVHEPTSLPDDYRGSN